MKHKIAMFVTIVALLSLGFLPSAHAAVDYSKNPCVMWTIYMWRDRPVDMRHMLLIEKRESMYTQTAASSSSIGCTQIMYSAHRKWLTKLGVTKSMLKIAQYNIYVARLLWNQQGYVPWRLTA